VTNADASTQKILEDRIQLRQANGCYEAIISARLNVYRAWANTAIEAKSKVKALMKEQLTRSTE
jgi:hypothetical protein